MSSLPQFFRGSSETEQEISSGRCAIRTIVWHNDHTAKMFLQIFNLPASSVTVGTTTPTVSLGLAADTTQDFPLGDALFDTGFVFAITTTTGGSTAGGVHDVIISVV